jgi:hypothetical protein
MTIARSVGHRAHGLDSMVCGNGAATSQQSYPQACGKHRKLKNNLWFTADSDVLL